MYEIRQDYRGIGRLMNTITILKDCGVNRLMKDIWWEVILMTVAILYAGFEIYMSLRNTYEVLN